MKLKIVKSEKNHLEIAFSGEGHTLLNLLQSNLLDDDDVIMAGYSKPHPLMDQSTLYVTMKEGKSFEKILLTATNNAKNQVSEFQQLFEKAIKKIK